jgi:Xaa-Pro aminopeptidase
VVIVFKDKAIMFVDGRYKVQVTEQVTDKLYSFKSLSEFEGNSWLDQELTSHNRIGVDLKLHAFSWYKRFIEVSAEKSIHCISIGQNLIDLCWKERPDKKLSQIKVLEEKYHGQSSQLKRTAVGDLLKATKVDSAIITSLDAISWLLNLRGRDIPCLPVFYATVIINQNGDVICFLDLKKMAKNIKSSFDSGVSFQCKSFLDKHLLSISDKIIQIDPLTINACLVELLQKDGVEIVESLDPISLLKAQKNSTELLGFKACHLRDANAVINFLSWLAHNTDSKNFYDEATLSNKLESYRANDGLYQQPSFDTVSAVGSNAAMCHYNHNDSTPKLMTNNSIYLVDSGAHYLDGSTDVTRTVAIGKVTNEQIKMATLVLKGHIALAQMKFPHGTSGQHLDAFARQYLWQHGYDYAHGTGHGVGHYLNVHEGPQRIAKFNSEVALLPGMIVSIEPGYYREGKFGIRHENLYFVKESESLAGAEIPILEFEVLTYVPFDQKLVDKALLSQSEINWLNNYHRKVNSHISPLVNDTSITWLKRATKAI